MYKRLIKPLLFLLPPDLVHRLVVMGGRAVQAVPPLHRLLAAAWSFRHDSLVQRIDGIDFQNPVGLSAGFDKNAQLTLLMESVGFGFASGGSVTSEPRPGNARPWFRRLPRTQSVVVHAGMPNQGLPRISRYIRRNQLRVQHTPTVLSVAVIANQTTRQRGAVSHQDIIDDVKQAVQYILTERLAAVIEINISCPNAGKEPFIQPESLEGLLGQLDAIERTIPFWVKMPHLYDMAQFDALLRVVAQHNVQGVTVANLVKDRHQIDLRDPLTDDMPGGLSGLPTRDHSLQLIRRAYRQYGDRLTIIGVGGVFHAADAYAKIRAGASLVGLVTGLFFEGPQVVGRINRGLVELLQADGYTHIGQAIGADHRPTSPLAKTGKKV